MGDEIEKGISEPADSGCGCAYECVCRHSECVCGTRRSGVGKTRLGASSLACPSAGLLPGPPWLGRLVEVRSCSFINQERADRREF